MLSNLHLLPSSNSKIMYRRKRGVNGHVNRCIGTMSVVSQDGESDTETHQRRPTNSATGKEFYTFTFSPRRRLQSKLPIRAILGHTLGTIAFQQPTCPTRTVTAKPQAVVRPITDANNLRSRPHRLGDNKRCRIANLDATRCSARHDKPAARASPYGQLLVYSHSLGVATQCYFAAIFFRFVDFSPI